MKSNLITIIILIIGSLISCADSNQESTHNISSDQTVGIINGTVITANHPLARHVFSLRFHYDFKSDRSYQLEHCSASAIHKRIILAAAHCIPKKAKDFKAYILARNLDGSDRKINIIDHIQHEDFISESAVNDLALFYLAEDLPTNIATLSLLPVANQNLDIDEIIMAGFGTEFEHIKKSFKDLKLRSGFAKTVKYESGQPSFLIDNSAETSICHGDSGGPALVRRSDGRYLVVGVASTVVYKKGAFFKCRHEGLYMNTEYHSNWIVDNVKKLIARNKKGS